MAVNKAQLAQHMLRSMKAAGSTVWDGEKAVVGPRGEEEAKRSELPEGGETAKTRENRPKNPRK